jgi:hypothetical protein
MSWLSDAWDWGKGQAEDAYGRVDDSIFGGALPGGHNPGDPARSGGPYEGIDRSNFDMPGYQGIQDRYTNYLNGIDSRGAPTIGQYQNAAASGFAGDQRGLAQLLSDRANGRGVSVADLQMQQGFDRANQAQRSMMAGATPNNRALALRLGSQNMAANDMDLAGQAALARAQESQMAASNLGAVLAQGRGADENLNMFNAGQQNQRTGQQAQMQQNQYAINDQARGGLLSGSLQAAQAQQQGGQNYEQNRTSRFGAVLGVPTLQEQQTAAITGLGKGLMMGGG